MSLAASLVFAFANLLHPRMLWLMLWPVLVALVLWGTLAVVYWTQLVVWLAGILGGWLSRATFFLDWDPATTALFAAKVLALLAFVPLVQVTALIILAMFGMPAMVRHVASRSYPGLERRRGGRFAGSAWNGVVSLLGMAGFALLSIPLWLFPPLWPVIPVAIMGWVNQRVLRYDALAEHADLGEMRRIFRERRWNMYLLGALLALIAYVPLIGLFAPVAFGLAFIHYLLGALRSHRRNISHAQT
jgi:CysZ protein